MPQAPEVPGGEGQDGRHGAVAPPAAADSGAGDRAGALPPVLRRPEGVRPAEGGGARGGLSRPGCAVAVSPCECRDLCVYVLEN